MGAERGAGRGAAEVFVTRHREPGILERDIWRAAVPCGGEHERHRRADGARGRIRKDDGAPFFFFFFFCGTSVGDPGGGRGGTL